MKTMIAVPCMQTVPTKFMRCLVGLQRIPDTYTMIMESTLIHDARTEFTSMAITKGSDMVFQPDLLERLSARMDEGRNMVCGLFFKRVLPTAPVIYSRFDKGEDPYLTPVPYKDYQGNGAEPFQVAACGFGAVMTDVGLLRRVWDKYGPPFSYYRNLGEDMSFCYRVGELGETIWCDPEISVGHIGQYIFSEETYLGQRGGKDCE